MLNKELTEAINIIKVAGEEVLKIYNSTSLDIEIKEDNSPVTKADKLADKIIREYLSIKFPHYAFLTEESSVDFLRLENDYVWIIDPLDGTQDFVDHNVGFAVNIALAYKHEVVVGVVYVPATGDLYFASKGQGSYHLHDDICERIHVDDKTSDLTCLVSIHFFMDSEKELIERHRDKISQYYPAGASIKACLIAEGKAEISYRHSPNTKEWDTAAPQIILEEAGGLLLKPDGSRMTYNRKDVRNLEGYVLLN